MPVGLCKAQEVTCHQGRVMSENYNSKAESLPAWLMLPGPLQGSVEEVLHIGSKKSPGDYGAGPRLSTVLTSILSRKCVFLGCFRTHRMSLHRANALSPQERCGSCPVTAVWGAGLPLSLESISTQSYLVGDSARSWVWQLCSGRVFQVQPHHALALPTAGAC